MTDYSEESLGKLWANTKALSNICEGKTEDIGTLIGTSFVARDLMAVVDALGEDGLLRYWGKYHKHSFREGNRLEN